MGAERAGTRCCFIGIVQGSNLGCALSVRWETSSVIREIGPFCHFDERGFDIGWRVPWHLSGHRSKESVDRTDRADGEETDIPGLGALLEHAFQRCWGNKKECVCI